MQQRKFILRNYHIMKDNARSRKEAVHRVSLDLLSSKIIFLDFLNYSKLKNFLNRSSTIRDVMLSIVRIAHTWRTIRFFVLFETKCVMFLFLFSYSAMIFERVNIV